MLLSSVSVIFSRSVRDRRLRRFEILLSDIRGALEAAGLFGEELVMLPLKSMRGGMLMLTEGVPDIGMELLGSACGRKEPRFERNRRRGDIEGSIEENMLMRILS